MGEVYLCWTLEPVPANQHQKDVHHSWVWLFSCEILFWWSHYLPLKHSVFTISLKKSHSFQRYHFIIWCFSRRKIFNKHIFRKLACDFHEWYFSTNFHALCQGDLFLELWITRLWYWCAMRFRETHWNDWNKSNIIFAQKSKLYMIKKKYGLL